VRRSFTLEPRPDDVIRGDVRLPDPGAAPDGLPRTAVLVVHGFKGFKDWAFFPYTADRLAAAGHAVVSFNFSRNGVGEDLLTFSELEKFGANTLSLELEELHLLLDRVLDGSLTGSAPERVGLLGHSRGGGSAIIAASEDDRVDSLVTWAAVASFDRWAEDTKAEWRREGRIWIPNLRTRQQMPLDVALLEDFEANRERLDVLRAAGRVDRPWLVVHGTDDDTVDPADGRELVAAGPRTTGHWVEAAGHTFEARHPFEAPPRELDAAVRATLAHFDGTLRG
jgi:uncharacterized protein